MTKIITTYLAVLLVLSLGFFGIGTMASAHVCASVPNFLVLEFHWLHRDFWPTIIQDHGDIIQDGYIEIPDRPGIGLELNEEVASQHQFPGTAWFAE